MSVQLLEQCGRIGKFRANLFPPWTDLETGVRTVLSITSRIPWPTQFRPASPLISWRVYWLGES